MKRCSFLGHIVFVVLFLSLSVYTASGQSKSPKGERSLVILHDNDVHCAIDGYAKVAGLRDAIRDTADVLLVSSGDFLQGAVAGAISKGQYIVDIMKTVGYDAVAFGNHEFDYKIPRLRELMAQIHAPVVCANLVDMKTGKTLFAPYIIRGVGRHRVAFVGAVTPSTMQSDRFAFYSDKGEVLYSLMPEQVYSLVQKAVDKARAEGADIVVVLSHLGEDKTDEDVDSHGLVAKTRGIDVVFDAHTHSLIVADTVRNLDGKPIVITQTGSSFANIGKCLIMPDGRMSQSMIPVSEIKHRNGRVAMATEEVKKRMEQVTSRVVGHCDYVLRILDDADEYLVRYAETNAADLLADAFIAATGAEIAIINGGGIRNQPKAGDLTYGDFISMLPYDNLVQVVEVKGSTIVELLRLNTMNMSYDNGNFPQVAGLRYTIHTGIHSVTDVEVLQADGKYSPIEPDRYYKVATMDYCVTGGGFGGILRDSKVLQQTNINYRDAMIDFVEKDLKGVIGINYAKPQGRITVVE